MRILIAGIVGGITIFIWGVFSHVILPLGEMGFRELPREEAVVSAMSASMTERGVYLIPNLDFSKEMTPEEEEAYIARYEAGPLGFVVYQPQGRAMMSPQQLVSELGSNIVAALIAALIVSMIVGDFLTRVFVISLLGAFGWLAISLSYWNWYGFPPDFTIAEGIDQVVGWLIAGVPIAALTKRKRKTG